jgi:hypothetical protein
MLTLAGWDAQSAEARGRELFPKKRRSDHPLRQNQYSVIFKHVPATSITTIMADRQLHFHTGSRVVLAYDAFLHTRRSRRLLPVNNSSMVMHPINSSLSQPMSAIYSWDVLRLDFRCDHSSDVFLDMK